MTERPTSERRGAGLAMTELSMALDGGGAGNRSRSWIGTLEAVGWVRPARLPAALQRENSVARCPQAQQSMQRGGSLQAARRWSLLRQRKQRPLKRLKKAARAGLGWAARPARERGMGDRPAGSGGLLDLRPRLETTVVHGTSEGSKAGSSWEGKEPTTKERRRGLASACWEEPWTAVGGEDDARSRPETRGAGCEHAETDAGAGERRSDRRGKERPSIWKGTARCRGESEALPSCVLATQRASPPAACLQHWPPNHNPKPRC